MLFVGLAVAFAVAIAFSLVVALTAAIAFSTPKIRLAGDAGVPNRQDFDSGRVPALRTVTARDGAPLAYRLYPGAGGNAVVLIHGSTGTSYDMDDVARALQAAGATVYSLDLRGHGGSGTTFGTTSYVGQLDDDLIDFMRAARVREQARHVTLSGYSAGGGFALRIASGPERNLFDAYLPVSPNIPDDTSLRQGGNAWVSLAKPRILGLYLLDSLGLPWFQQLMVARYARPCAPDNRCTPAYSYSLRMSLHLIGGWPAAAMRIDRPTLILADKEEVSTSPWALAAAALANKRITVREVPGIAHFEMLTSEAARRSIVATWRELSGERD